MTVSANEAPPKIWAQSDGTGRVSTVWGISGMKGQALALMGTLFLMIAAPGLVTIVYAVHTTFEGSLVALLQWTGKKGLTGLMELYQPPSVEAWTVIGIFGAIQAILQMWLPGAKALGPVTPKGNVPVYKANGVQAFVTTLGLFGVGWWSGIFSPARIYDLFGEILAALNMLALTLCLFLYIKGHLFPSTTDSGSTGNLVYDLYWGMELYPRIGKNFDIKTWTNCRMGMMSWGILILCYAAKQYELYGYVADSMIVSVVLMEIYVFKFFLWETGYWSSMDIAHDRAGYYLCWGCLNWVPGIYTSPALYLVKNPVSLGIPLAVTMLCAGALCVYINYDADRQRQEFRRTSGKAKVWGRPPKMIEAEYTTSSGEVKQSLLLASGWWGVARHFHYIPEILGAFCWTIPGLFNHGLQFFYVIFLTLLLADRAYRDDQRCRSKYGVFWDAYCDLVPFKLIPGLF